MRTEYLIPFLFALWRTIFQHRIKKPRALKVIPAYHNRNFTEPIDFKWRIIMRQLSSGLFLAIIMAIQLWAAPMDGKSFQFKQPDGSLVPVKVFGDEYYQRVESPDGRTLVRSSDGWIHYAAINSDSTDFVPLGIYRGFSLSKTVASQTLHAELRKSAIIGKSAVVRAAFTHRPVARALHKAAASTFTPLYYQPSGNIVGLTVLIQFPDHSAEIAQSVVDSFCNQVGYSQYSTNGSVRDFFARTSGGVLTYTNHVTSYYTAKHNFSWYDDSAGVTFGERSDSLMLEALTWLRDSQGFDFSTLSSHKYYDTVYNNQGTVIQRIDSTPVITALNFMYAGAPQNGWSAGLWPHSGWLLGAFTANGLTSYRYQICNLSSSSNAAGSAGPDLGTYAHEDGHMLCGYPDLYPATKANGVGVGSYCTMCYGCLDIGSISNPLDGGSHNPPPYNPFFRYECGWLNPLDITYSRDTTISLDCGDLSSVCMFRDTSDPTQMYFIEARRRDANFRTFKDSGLIIWRANINGDNFNTTTYLLSVEQADNRGDLESGANYGDSTDLFRQISGKAFSDATSPAANWVGSNYSGLDIRNVSTVSSTITFDIGTPSVVSSVKKTVLAREIGAELYKSELLLTVPIAGSYSISLYSLDGRRVSEQTRAVGIGKTGIKLPTEIAAGQYVLKINGAGTELVKTVHMF